MEPLGEEHLQRAEARCSVCDLLIPINNSAEHLPNCILQKPFSCDSCSARFNREVNLTVHQSVAHTSSQKCPVCRRQFKRLTAFKGHVAQHEIRDTFKCSSCENEFTHSVLLNRHIRLEHRDGKQLVEAMICATCGAILPPSELNEHNMKHKYEKEIQLREKKKVMLPKRKKKEHLLRHKCDQCGKAFYRPSELLRHSAVHSDEKPFQCNACGSNFGLESGLRYHQKIYHKHVTVKCKLCAMEFSSKFNLLRHVKGVHLKPSQVHFVEVVHNPPSSEAQDNTWTTDLDLDLDAITGNELAEQLFKCRQNTGEQLLVVPPNSLRCSVCLHAHASLELLLVHWQTLACEVEHASAEAACPVCKHVTRGSWMGDHLMAHGVRPPPVELRIREPAPRPFVCDVCERAFQKPSDVTRHKRIHTGEKPYVCRCGQRFSLQLTLKRHELTHGEADAPWKCPLTSCTGRFFSRSALRVHLQSHFLSCSYCSLTFRTREDRSVHVSREHSSGGGLVLPALPGAVDTLNEISRPSNPLIICPSKNSAFQALPPNNSQEEEDVYIEAHRMDDNMSIHLSTAASDSAFPVPQDLLLSLKKENGVLRARLGAGRVLSIHPEPTMCAVAGSRHIVYRPCESRTIGHVPLDVGSSFVSHCDVCNVQLATKDISDAHFNSEDHETADLLSPLRPVLSSPATTFQRTKCVTCKLCGNQYGGAAALVEHIRRDHERDHPKKLSVGVHTAPLH